MSDIVLDDIRVYLALKQRTDKTLAENLSQYLGCINKCMSDLLPKIHRNYPEYTDHSIQHSYRMLQHLGLLLDADGLSKLSTNELFCLIAAAMMHDSGMAVDNALGCSEGRDNHGDRSAVVVHDYFLNKQPTLIARNRYSTAIEFACKAHCMDREELRRDKLFAVTDQIDSSDIRYRLIAILLRLGDLLDIDESRTSEYVLSIFRDRYSKESLLHHLKHLNLQLMYLSDNEIQIQVCAHSIEEYEICEHWFKMLREEIDFANKHLQKDGFKFPIPKTEIVDAANQVIRAETIRFDIDDKGIIWDVISQSIYTDKLDFLRELIQNAIDATLARAYSNDKIKIEQPSPRSWGPKNCEHVLVGYSAKAKQLYISDSGIGMDEQDLTRFLFKISGSGYKSLNNRDFQFPAIAKFGIGFISCLVHASYIRLFTRKTDHKDAWQVSLNADRNVALMQAVDHIPVDGTTILLTLKKEFAVEEIRSYISRTFRYPSVGITFVDVDKMKDTAETLGTDHFCTDLKEKPYLIAGIVKSIQDHLQEKTAPLNGLCKKLQQVDEKTESIVDKLKSAFYRKKNAGEKSKFTAFLMDIIPLNTLLTDPQIGLSCPLIIPEMDENSFDDTMDQYRYQLEAFLEQVRAKHQQNLVEVSKYAPVFCHHTNADSPVRIGVAWNYYVIEMNETLHVADVYASKKPVDLSGKRGLLFVRTSKQDHRSGMEYDTLTGVCFCNNQVCDSLVSMIFEDSENVDIDQSAVALGFCGTVADFIQELHWYQEQYEYGATWGLYSANSDQLPDAVFNLIQINNNTICAVSGVSAEDLDDYLYYHMDGQTREKRIIDNAYGLDIKNHEIVDKLDDFERIIRLKDSMYYQDGISIQLDMSSIFPAGWFRIICNCTGDARMPLNVTRHKTSELDQDVLHWIEQYGMGLQKELVDQLKEAATNCSLSCNPDELMMRTSNSNGTFAQKCHAAFRLNTR